MFGSGRGSEGEKFVSVGPFTCHLMSVRRTLDRLYLLWPLAQLFRFRPSRRGGGALDTIDPRVHHRRHSV